MVIVAGVGMMPIAKLERAPSMPKWALREDDSLADTGVVTKRKRA